MCPSLRAAACALLLLASHAQAGPRSATAIAAGEGAVLLTVSVDYPSAVSQNAVAPGMIPQVSVQKVDEPAQPFFVLAPRLEGLQSARAYAGSLPPGRYRIHDVMGSTKCLFCGGEALSKPKVGDVGEFTVAAGQVAWLGDVLVAPQAPVPPAKAWTADWGWQPQPDLAIGSRLLAGLYPELHATGAPLVAGWVPPDDGGLFADARRRDLRAAASGLFEPSPYGADGFFAGAQHGVVKRWSPSQGLRLVDTGSPWLLRSVVHAADGRMLVGGEAGTLLQSADDGRTWTDASAGLPFGIVVQAKSIGGDALVFTLLHGKSVSLYRGKLGDAQWEKLGDYPLEFKFWTGLPGVYPELQVQGRRIALTLPSKSGVFVDLDSGETHPITPPGSIASFTYSPDGVMRCTCFRSIAANPWESRDLGRTWTDSPLDRWMGLPAWRNAQEGFSYKGAMFSAKKAGVMHTRDGAQTWTQSPGPPFGMWWRPAYSADGSVMLLTGMANEQRRIVEQAHVSVDGGATWQQWTTPGTAPADMPGPWLHTAVVSPPMPTPAPNAPVSGELATPPAR